MPARRVAWALTRGLWRRSLQPRAYWFGESDAGSAEGSGEAAAVARAERQLDAVWGAHRGDCGQNSVPSAVAIRIDRRFDNDANAFSITRLRNRFNDFLQADVAGRTCVEIGPGAHNPYSLLVVLALLGARRAIGIEPVPVHDESVAAVGAARAATFLLAAPQLVAGDTTVDQRLLLDNAQQFDLAKLWRGDLSGLDGSVLELHNGSIYESGLATASVDYLFSNSVLEHLARPEDAVAEVARITAPGALMKHFIDGVDHNTYLTPGIDDIGFLRFEASHAMVNGSNRVRPLSFRDLFEAHGFEQVALTIDESVAVDGDTRSTLADPWRSMPDEYLSIRKAFLEMRRTGDAAAGTARP